MLFFYYSYNNSKQIHEIMNIQMLFVVYLIVYIDNLG